MTLHHKQILINGVSIHYADSCDTQDCDTQNTLVFLHGFPECWISWQSQLSYFGSKHRVIAPDLPGYNLSDKPKDASFYQVQSLIDFMATFIRTVNQDKPVTLVAHDWGGALAWPLTAFFPDLINKLVILNAAHPSTFTREMIHNAEQRRKSAYIHQMIADTGAELLRKNHFAFLQTMLFESRAHGQFSLDERQYYLGAWAREGAVDGMLNYYRNMPQLAPPGEGELSGAGPVRDMAEIKVPNIRIDVPTLVLWGEKDEAFVPQLLDGLEDYVPQLTIRKFPLASHWLHHEFADEVNQAIARFIAPG